MIYNQIKEFFIKHEVDQFLIFEDELQVILGYCNSFRLKVLSGENSNSGKLSLQIKLFGNNMRGTIEWNGREFVNPSLEPIAISIYDLRNEDNNVVFIHPEILSAMKLDKFTLNLSE